MGKFDINAIKNSIAVNDNFDFGTTYDNFTREEVVEQPVENNTIVSNIDNERLVNFLIPSKLDQNIKLSNLIPAPHDWNFFPVPDRDTMLLIMRSIYAQGQLTPAIVWEREDGKYTILGGHTRFAAINAIQELVDDDEKERFSYMRCHIYSKEQLSEEDAKQILILNNMTQRAQEKPSILLRSVIAMVNLEKRNRHRVWGESNRRISEIVAERYGIGKSTINRFYSLRMLNDGLLSLLDDGVISQKDALKYAKMDNEVQAYIYENKIYEMDLSNDQFKALYELESPGRVDAIVTAPVAKTYSYSGGKVAISREIPSNFHKFSLAAAKSDMDEVKRILLDAIDKAESLNEDTKSILMESIISQ